MGDSLYKMKVPNIEIQKSLNSLFFDYLTKITNSKAVKQYRVFETLRNINLDGFKNEIKALFAAIPFTNYVKNNMGEYEGYYASVIFTFLASLGFDIVAEDYTNKGRIDMTIKTPDAIFILEFKVDMQEEAAIQQIKTNKYYEKYLTENKNIYIIGMHFSSTEKNIVSFEWEELAR